uniref:Uncharacterized protein n=1 Tax=Lactuca sativa TaxID=4236 RepID=A0A9R1UZG9_LACSA|nr:hypothetical protein LSAT_V11C700348790 [Lactuca sativa]
MMKYTVTGFQLPFKVWILETFPEALRFAHHTENEIPRMRAWRIKTQLSLEQCLRILDISVGNNISRVFEPTSVLDQFSILCVLCKLDSRQSVVATATT